MINTNRILLQLNEYIEYKHSLGFEIKHEECVLRNFVKYTLESEYDGPLTREIVFEWISSGIQTDKTMGRKLEAVRPFMKYAAVFDEDAEVICGRVYRNVHERPVPYIYTEDETMRLMNQCNGLYSPDGIRSKTVAIVIGLLWATGLRPSEATQLQNRAVDTDNNIIHVINTKFGKERLVPIDSSVSKHLTAYRGWISEKIGCKGEDEPFFYTTGGNPLSERAMSYAFQKIRGCIDAKTIGYPAVRLYDFRHTMASRTIMKWSEQGEDINTKLHILSVYMGHVKPQDTYWYISATPEIMNQSCAKYEELFGGDYDEI